MKTNLIQIENRAGKLKLNDGVHKESADWWKWDFSTPPKLTIDDGRVTKELEALWKIGAANMRDIVSMRGKTYEEHIRERAAEVALRKLAAAEAAELYGVPVDDREMAMLTPNEMQQPRPTDDNENEPDSNQQPSRETEAE